MRTRAVHCERGQMISRWLLTGLLLVSCAKAAAQDGITPAAKHYLDSALQTMRANSLHRERVDWEGVRRIAYAEAAGAEVPADTYQAIRLSLEALGDGHSFLMLSNDLAELEERRRRERGLGPVPERDLPASQSQLFYRRNLSLDFFDFDSELAARIIVPSAFSQSSSRTYAEKARLLLGAAKDSCGFIVDLRGNGGGNTWPMALGLYPLLGEGIFGGSEYADGRRESWILTPQASGMKLLDGRQEMYWETDAQAGPDLRGRPVAVLLDDAVGSSGEAIAVAFSGRPNTRSFGRRTSGASTSNDSFRLSDGANMLITVANFIDRTGRVFPNGLEPDELVETKVRAPEGYSPALRATLDPQADPDVRIALAWLAEQPNCKGTGDAAGS